MNYAVLLIQESKENEAQLKKKYNKNKYLKVYSLCTRFLGIEVK